MNGWMLFLLIAFVLGIIISNILLLKHSAKMKLPDSVLKSIKEKKQAEEIEQKEKENKKPTNK